MSHLHTTDPLGLGGLLFDAARIEQLTPAKALRDEELAALVMAAASDGLAAFADEGTLHLPADRRLPFRELGLAIGLHGLELLEDIASSARVRTSAALLERYLPLAAEIAAFWRAPDNRTAATWTAHRDINDVMLATALAPEGFLVLEPPAGIG